MKILQFFFLLLFLYCTNLSASDCGVLQFLKNKSHGVSIQKNACEKQTNIAIGTKIDLTPGARIWLKSFAKPDLDHHFQVICQNKSSFHVKLEVSRMFLPWMNPVNLDRCSSWIDNKLTCEDQNGNANRFFCAIASIKNPQHLIANEIERTTSVKMRTVDFNKGYPLAMKDLIEIFKPEISLCRYLYQTRQTIDIKWTINDLGKVEDIAVSQIKSGKNSLFMECVEAVVKSYKYPVLAKNTNYSHQF